MADHPLHGLRDAIACFGYLPRDGRIAESPRPRLQAFPALILMLNRTSARQFDGRPRSPLDRERACAGTRDTELDCVGVMAVMNNNAQNHRGLALIVRSINSILEVAKPSRTMSAAHGPLRRECAVT